jgi:hypothetical protein
VLGDKRPDRGLARPHKAGEDDAVRPRLCWRLEHARRQTYLPKILSFTV